MSFNISIHLPSLDDVAYFLRAGLSRPRDIPGIIRRELRRRKYNTETPPPPDLIGASFAIEGWETAFSVGMLTAPPGDGPTLRLYGPLDNPFEAISRLQFASAVEYHLVEEAPLFPVISLEAARLGLKQSASEPMTATRIRKAFVETAHLSDGLREALRELAEEPIERL